MTVTARASHRQIPLASDDAAVISVHPNGGTAVVSNGAHDVLHLVQPPLRGEKRQVPVVPMNISI